MLRSFPCLPLLESRYPEIDLRPTSSDGSFLFRGPCTSLPALPAFPYILSAIGSMLHRLLQASDVQQQLQQGKDVKIPQLEKLTFVHLTRRTNSKL